MQTISNNQNIYQEIKSSVDRMQLMYINMMDYELHNLLIKVLDNIESESYKSQMIQNCVSILSNDLEDPQYDKWKLVSKLKITYRDILKKNILKMKYLKRRGVL